MKQVMMLRIILVLIGVVIMFMGLNIGLGGIVTLGWLSTNELLTVTNLSAYLVQDNHIRFIGGIWFAMGGAFFIGGFDVQKMRQTLISLCMMIGIAALFRFSIMDSAVVLNAAILPSLGLEIIGFPVLGMWLRRVELV